MRKHYFFMMALLLQLINVNVFAQSYIVEDLGDPLIDDVSQITSNASDEAEGQNLEYLIDWDGNTFWHSDWHNKVSDAHYLQFELKEPIQGNLVLYMQRRNNGAGHASTLVIYTSADGKAWDEKATLKFTNTDANAELLGDNIILKEPVNFVRVVHPRDADGFVYMHMAEINLFNPTDEVETATTLNNILLKYDTYLGNIEEMFNLGTEFGQCADIETAQKFEAAVESVYDLLDKQGTPDFPTLEAANQLSADIDSMFQKVLDSEVLYRLPAAEGYYRIVCTIPYYKDVKIGEDEDGQAITERQFQTKAMYASVDKKACYGPINRDLGNYIWKLTQVNDSIDMYNPAMQTRISDFGSTVLMSEEADQHVMFDFAEKDEQGRDIIMIRPTYGVRTTGEKYLHQWSHSKGNNYGDSFHLCVWKDTHNMGEMYATDKGTSEWYLEPVDEAEALAQIEAFGPIRDHDLLVAQNNKLRETVGKALTIAKDDLRIPMIKEAAQMSSPCSQNDWGKRDGGDLEEGVLIDNNPDSFWHSVWEENDFEGNHYIQLSDMDELQGRAELYIYRRKTDAGHITDMIIKGSNDPDAEDEAWEEITTLKLGNASNGKEYTSEIFNVETPYSNIRLYNANAGYWHAAELQINRIDVNPNSQYIALGKIASDLDAIYQQNCDTPDEDITLEMYNALQEAYDLFKEGAVDPAAMRKALKDYANADKMAVEGTEPGMTQNMEGVETFKKLYDEVTEYDAASKYKAEKVRQYAIRLQLAAKNIMSGANGIDTNKWYNLRFPTEEMYDEYGWGRGNVGHTEFAEDYFIFGKYATVAEGSMEMAPFDFEDNEITDNMGLYFMDKDEMTGENASQFRFLPYDRQEALYEDFSELKSNAALAVSAATTYKYSDNLLTNPKNLTSNASDSAEGQHIEYLVDGDASTWWHSDWHNAVKEPHYLQVKFDEPISGGVQVVMTRRPNEGANNLTKVFVTGSNDANEWTGIGYMNMPYVNPSEVVTTTPLALNEPYSYLRFIFVDNSNRNNPIDPFGTETVFSHMAEFQIRQCTSEMSSAAQTLSKTLAAVDLKKASEVTKEDYTTLATAYKALEGELSVDGKNILPAVEENPGLTYVMQNKATGLFVHSKEKNNNDVTINLMPTFYNFKAIGYSEILLHGFNLDGSDCTNLHTQRGDARLVTWNATEAGSNSGLMLEAVADVEGTEDFSFLKGVRYGKFNSWCFPVTLTNMGDADGGVAYELVGKFTEDEDTYLAFNETETIKAGKPFIYLLGEPEEYLEEDEYEEPMMFGLTTELALEPDTINGHQGTYFSTPMTDDALYFDGNTVKCTQSSVYKTDANEAVIALADVAEVEADGTYDLVICISEATEDADGVKAIQNTMDKLSQAGAVYTIDGRQVRANATLKDIKSLGRGTYILNGVKVMVK